MCGGGSSNRQKESEQEVALFEQARSRLDEWQADGYKNLELEQIRDADRDLTHLFKGRANADIEQAAKGINPANMAASLNTIQSTKNKANVDAHSSNLDLQTGHKLNAMKVGQDVSATNDISLASAAERGSMKARQDLQNNLLNDTAKGQAIGTAINGGLTGLMATDYLSFKPKKREDSLTDLMVR